MSDPATSSSHSKSDVAIGWMIHAAAIASCAMVLVAVGQPIFSDDVWWHLALGEAHLREGPWLAGDPLLFTSKGPPPPASWLADILFRVVWNHLGFAGLRLFHLGLVASCLVLVWASVRHATRSASLASLSAALVGTLSAYRLVQLRPHLATILAALLLHWLLFRDSRPPSWQRGLAAVGLMGLWANLHPAYPLGPVLVAIGAVGLFVASILPRGSFREDGPSFDSERARVRARAIRLAGIASMGFVATLLNPLGLAGYRSAFEAGSGQGGLAVVVDEWSRIDLLSWPTASLPPSPMNWAVAWLLVIAVPLATAIEFRSHWQRSSTAAANRVDPAIISLAWAGLVAMLTATRFAWMVFWPVLFLACHLRQRLAIGPRRAIGGAAVASVALFLAFPRWGDWPMVTRGLPRTLAGYLSPYATGKYHTAAVAVLREARLEGNLFGRYSEGGFQSFWLAPAIRTAMNGSLNMSEEAFAAALAIRERIGTPAHPRFEEALDALGVDLFLGTGLPRITRPGRPPDHSTLHLEGAPGWILIFRNLDSALHLRKNARNRRNLRRIAAYYARHDVPFDAERGFDPARVLRESPDWARRMGLWSTYLDRRLDRQSPPTDDASIRVDKTDRARGAGSDRLALGYLALGIYGEAEAENEQFLRQRPGDARALRRRGWLLLRPHRIASRQELVRAIRGLSTITPRDRLTLGLLDLLRRKGQGRTIPERESRTIPVLSRMEARALLVGRASPLLTSTDLPAHD
ncbi:MAG TPA: hypothetical protein ENI85_09630 [Deltaproteobacteria bacterium]|nr:hypothetical protein [Deltaproteobacteria bacterium]